MLPSPSLGLVALFGVACAAPPAPQQVDRLVVAMGTTLHLQVTAADRATGLLASEAALQQVEAAEAVWSTWRDDSEVCRLHRAPVGQVCAVSAQLVSGLQAAAHWARSSQGAFDPCLGALVEAYSLRAGGRWPQAGEVADALAACGVHNLRLTEGAVVRLHPGVRIAAGGFAKGLALDAAAKAAVAAGAQQVMLDFGGQVLVAGTARTRVGVADPRDRTRVVLHLDLGRGSVATTGNSERGLVVDGRLLGHVLDPRTGAPAPDFGSVTVWADDALAADCLSTALFVLGPQQALAWARRHPGVEVLVLRVVGQGLEATCTEGLRHLVTAIAPELTLPQRTSEQP